MTMTTNHPTTQLTSSQAADIAERLAGNHRPTTASNLLIGQLADMAGCSQGLADDLAAAAANRQAAGHDADRLAAAAADWLLTADTAGSLGRAMSDADLQPTKLLTNLLACMLTEAITLAELADIRAGSRWLQSMAPGQAAELTELTGSIRAAATDRLTSIASNDSYRPFQQPANPDGSRPAVPAGSIC